MNRYNRRYQCSKWNSALNTKEKYRKGVEEENWDDDDDNIKSESIHKHHPDIEEDWDDEKPSKNNNIHSNRNEAGDTVQSTFQSDEENWDDQECDQSNSRNNKPKQTADEENWDNDECDQEIEAISSEKHGNNFVPKSHSDIDKSSPSNFSRRVLTTPSPVEEEVSDRFGQTRSRCESDSFYRSSQVEKAKSKRSKTDQYFSDSDRKRHNLFMDKSRAYEKGSFYIETPNNLDY